MEILVIICVFVILTLIFFGITSYFGKKTKILNALLSFVFSLFIILFSWINAPCIIGLSEDYIYKNNALCIVFEWYNAGGIAYIIISNIILSFIILLVCGGLKYLESKEIFLKKKDVCKEFNQFSKDATTLIIIGKDLDFLLDPNCTEQYEKIKALNSGCTILCQELIKPLNFKLENKDDVSLKYCKLVQLYNDLLELKVDIKCFPTKLDEKYKSLKKILGQIKDTATSTEIKIVTKEKKNFKNINIQYRPIENILKNVIKEVHSKAKNPIIKCIVVDVAGVAFDGKLDDFYERLSNEMKINIPPFAEDKTNLNVDLSLGKIDINEVVEQRAKIKLKNTQKNKIIEIWKTIWTPNNEIFEILKELSNNGYEIIFMSNLDSLNANHYKIRYFPNIPNYRLFLSCEEGVCKPDPESFNKFEKKFSFLPSQILLIDDQNKVINGAEEAKWKTLRFDITTMKADDLREKLENLSLLAKRNNA